MTQFWIFDFGFSIGRSECKKIFCLALGALLLAFSAPARGQQAKTIPHIGYLGVTELSSADSAFRKGLRELGYVEGQSIAVKYRYAGGKTNRLPHLAADLVNLNVDVIVASGTQSIEAAKQATQTIPIIFPITPDPVKSGFVSSLARPGGNITGFSTLNPDLGGKRLELLTEVIPGITRVAVLLNPTNPGALDALKEIEIVARSLKLKLQSLEVRGPEDFDSAFRSANRERVGAFAMLGDSMLSAHQGRIRDLAIKYRLPGISWSSGFVTTGGLMSYGPSIADLYPRSATYVDKILRGAKPADLPVEQPMKFELIINLKAAKQIGLTIPPNVLVRADRVIK